MVTRTPHNDLPIDIKQTSVSDLVRMHTAIVDELLARKLSRTRATPVAALPTHLVATAYEGAPAGRGSAWEVETPDQRIAVRGRLRLPTDRPSLTFGHLSGAEFDVAVFVIVDALSCEVVSAVEVPAENLPSPYGPSDPSSRGVRLDADLLAVDGARDVTADLQAAMGKLDAERFARRQTDDGSGDDEARPTGWCLCGCGERTDPGARFLVMHDRRAESPALRERYGTIAGLVV